MSDEYIRLTSTSPGDPFLFISTHDLAVGLARRDCPACGSLLLIRLPSMQDAISDTQSASLQLSLGDVLTATEQCIFNAVHAHYPRGVATAEVERQVYGISDGSMRAHLHRMRPKLLARGWKLMSRNRTMRLVGP